MVFEAGHRLALDLEAHDGVGSIPFLLYSDEQFAHLFPKRERAGY
jgi:hypothetical protein